MPVAEDGSVVPDSYYGTPEPQSSSSGGGSYIGEAQVPSGSRSGGNIRVIRPSGASVVARVPSHITVRDGDTVRFQRESLESTAIAAKGTFVVIENLDHSPQANPVSDVSGSPGSTVGGSTSGDLGDGPYFGYGPALQISAYGNAGTSNEPYASRSSLNENREVLRDIETRLENLEDWLNNTLRPKLNELSSLIEREQTRNAQNDSRLGSVESSVNDTKAVVQETKDATNKVTKAVKRAGIGFTDKNYGGGVVSGMVTRRNMMTDYARVRVNSENEENAFVGSFHDLQRGDYVKVNTSGGTGTWTIEGYMDPADIGL